MSTRAQPGRVHVQIPPATGATTLECMNTIGSGKSTAAFHAQAAISFGIALVSVALGVLNLDASPWVRAFLGLGVLYLVTSTFTLAKVVRDNDERAAVASRVDQARVDRILTEHDPFKEPA